MKIDGTVTTGLGKAAYFLSQDFYVNNFKKKLWISPVSRNFKCYSSRRVPSSNQQSENECKNIIKPDEGFGAVKYIKARLNDEVTGAIVFPAKTTHEENYLEFIAKDKLRDKLNLEDGDTVSVEF